MSIIFEGTEITELTFNDNFVNKVEFEGVVVWENPNSYLTKFALPTGINKLYSSFLPIEELKIRGEHLINTYLSNSLQLYSNVEILVPEARNITWSCSGSSATITQDGLLSVPAGTKSGTVTVS